nr:hypothetical protein [Actinocatenispora sera]
MPSTAPSVPAPTVPSRAPRPPTAPTAPNTRPRSPSSVAVCSTVNAPATTHAPGSPTSAISTPAGHTAGATSGYRNSARSPRPNSTAPAPNSNLAPIRCPSVAATTPPTMPPAACTAMISPYARPVPCSTSLTHGAISVLITPSPSAVTAKKISTTRTVGSRTASRRPASQLRSGGSGSVRGSAPEVRIRATSAAATRKLARSASATAGSPPSPAATPPSAAPTSRAMLRFCPSSAFAVTSSSSTTSRGSSAASAGVKNCSTQVSTSSTR